MTTYLEVNPLVSLADARQACEDVLLLAERITENHEESSDDGEVAEEEVNVEDEAVSEALYDDDCEECAYGRLGEFAHDDGYGCCDHDLCACAGAKVQGSALALLPSYRLRQLTTTLMMRKR